MKHTPNTFYFTWVGVEHVPKYLFSATLLYQYHSRYLPLPACVIQLVSIHTILVWLFASPLYVEVRR